MITVCLLLCVGTIFAGLIPPLQSPDEPAHLQRAYLLGKGELLLQSPPGQASGGHVDQGLLDYSLAFVDLQFSPETPLRGSELREARTLTWTGERVFSPLPGTGYYFSLIYAPQAVALRIGEALGLSIDKSYRLARAFALLTCLLSLTAAFSLFRPNLLVLGLLVLPMSLFQAVSSSIDGVCTGLAVLALALASRGIYRQHTYPEWMAWALALVLLLLTTSRIHLLPMLGLFLPIFWQRRRPTDLFLLLMVGGLSVGWILLALARVVDPDAANSLSNSHVLLSYLQQPQTFGRLLIATLSDESLRLFYWQSFVGVLGWLDTYFQSWFYLLSGIVLTLLAAASVSWVGMREDWGMRLLLVVLAAVCSLLVFLALLVHWNPFPAGDAIHGVQGRYFIVPALLLAFALSGSSPRAATVQHYAGLLLLLAYSLVVAAASSQLLISRYLLSDLSALAR
ncbi:MAG: DUF2142 domain-containing protein [Pseudomarimonas sp.]